MTDEQKEQIDNLSHTEKMDLWTANNQNEPIFEDGGWEYFLEVLSKDP